MRRRVVSCRLDALMQGSMFAVQGLATLLLFGTLKGILTAFSTIVRKVSAQHVCKGLFGSPKNEEPKLKT